MDYPPILVLIQFTSFTYFIIVTTGNILVDLGRVGGGWLLVALEIGEHDSEFFCMKKLKIEANKNAPGLWEVINPLSEIQITQDMMIYLNWKSIKI